MNFRGEGSRITQPGMRDFRSPGTPAVRRPERALSRSTSPTPNKGKDARALPPPSAARITELTGAQQAQPATARFKRVSQVAIPAGESQPPARIAAAQDAAKEEPNPSARQQGLPAASTQREATPPVQQIYAAEQSPADHHIPLERAAGVAVAAAAVNETGHSKVSKRNETGHHPTYKHLRFEPGDHGPNADTPEAYIKAQNMDTAFQHGNPDAHIWGQGLVDRIVAQQPEIIAIDGLGPGLYYPDSGKGAPALIPATSEEAWIALPTTPANINKAHRSVLVVNGDMSDLREPFDYTLKNNPEMLGLGQALAAKASKDEQQGPLQQEGVAQSIAILGAVVAFDVGGLYATGKSKKLSRRKFLGLAAVTTGLAALNVYGHVQDNQNDAKAYADAQKAATVDTESAKNEWLQAIDKIDPQVIQSNWVNMRTALLTLKTKDSIDKLGLPPHVSSSVIMGSGHSFDAEEYIHQDAKAQEAVRAYVDSIDPILRHYLHKHPSISRKDVVHRIKHYLAQTYVLQMDQPNEATFGTPAFPEAVGAATRTVANFRSQRVLDALESYH